MQQPEDGSTGSEKKPALLSTLLRALARVPVLIWMLLKAVSRQLFGDVVWNAPAWARWSGRRIGTGAAAARRSPRRSALALIILLLVLAGGWYAFKWWQAQPKPVEVSFSVTSPGRTEIENDDPAGRLPKPLTITFSDSAATLAGVGKDVGEGVTMTPAMKGMWHWNDDRTLIFTPAEDWPIGAQFKVGFEKKLFSPDVRIAHYDTQFSTVPLTVKGVSFKFYQDPINATVKQAVAELHFSYPVNPVELEKRIEMQLDQQSSGVLGIGKETTPFTVSYDKWKLNAYVRSASLPIPKDGGRLDFKLDKGVTALRGGPATVDSLSASVSIPGLYSLQIVDMAPRIVVNDKNEPEQVLVFGTTATVHEREMKKNISAWVLPKTHPDANGVLKPNSDNTAEDWDVSQITPAVLKLSTPLPLEQIPAEHEYTVVHSFRYHADVGARIYVQVASGLTSFGGYILGKTARQVVTAPPFPPELKILSQGALLTMSGDKKVAVLTRDLPGVKIEIGRVLPMQLQHLVSQANGNFANPALYGRFSADNLTERFESKVALPGLKRGRAHYEAVDLNPYLKGDGEARRGVFLLTVTGYDPAKEKKAESGQPAADRTAAAAGRTNADTGADCDDNCGNEEAGDADSNADKGNGNGNDSGNAGDAPESRTDSRLVIVTDLGILIKKWLDGSQDVFVQSIYTGKPVTGANVDIVGKNGLTLFSGTTDATGVAHFAKIDGLVRERAPLMVVVKKAGDLSFMPLNKTDRDLDMSRFDIGGAKNADTAGQVSAYLFSDRGIYRPGETFHIGIIAKSADWGGAIAGLPMEAEVLDPRGLTVKREKIKLPAGGFTELAYAPAEDAPTGTYNVNLYLVKDGKPGAQIGGAAVTVQEFQPDKMKIATSFTSGPDGAIVSAGDGWLNPKDLKLQINAQNLFGTPAESRRVSADVTLSPAFPAFRQYPDYKFYDPQRANDGFSDHLNDQTTDEKGNATFDLGLAKYAKATYRLQVLTRAFEPQGGRGVSAESSALVSELNYLVGYKADGALDFVSRGAARNVNLVALDSRAQKTAVQGLTLQLIERKYVSVLSKQPDGGYKYESLKKEILLKETPLAIPAAGLNLKLASDDPGNFAYVVRDAAGLEFSRIEYAVAGKGNVTRSLERNAELQLTLNKKSYNPGEDIEVSIRAPYTGSGLITIERDKVFVHQWFKADTLASVQKIRLPKDFEGNGYVSVQYIRDPSSDEIFMSPLSYGVAPFSTSLAARTDQLSLRAPDLVKPGQLLTMKLSSTRRTRAVVFAVDEGILQVARYQMPDPLGFFFQKKMLEVHSSQILDMILPEFNKLLAASAPGGDSEGPPASHLNPFKRKHDRPAVYWSGVVEINGDKELTYQVPDTFNGSMRIMAVAVNDSTIGTAQAKTTVRGDFVISPNVPLAVAPGDEFDVSVGVANNLAGSGKAAPVSLSLKTSKHLQVIGNATQTLQIGAMREGVASYRIKAVDGAAAMLGSASLELTASLGGSNSKVVTDVSVRPPVPRYASLSMGSFTGTADVPLTRSMYPQLRQLSAGVSTLPLVLADGLSSYLADFTHLCTEQVISQAVPAVVLSRRPEFGRADAGLRTARSIADTINLLRGRQNADGGFGLWNASVEADEFASVYALHLLLEARERGQAVPQDMLDKSLAFAQTLAASPGSTLPQLRVRAYAAYLLTRQMVVTTPLLTSIRESLEKRFPKDWQNDLAAAYLAASYQLQKQEKLANSLIDRQVDQLGKPAPAAAFSDYYDPSIRSAQLLYLLARHFPARAKALSPAAMTALVKPLTSGSFNTLSSAYLILGFDALADVVGPDTVGKLSITEIDAAGKQHALALPSSVIPRVPFAAGTQKLRFASDSKLTTYYAVTESGFDRQAPADALRAGMEVLREFTDAGGKVVSSVQVGDELTVHLKFRAVSRDAVAHVALVDLMPGGFEPILASPAESSGNIDPNANANGNADAGAGQGAQNAALASLGGATSNWTIEYADVREDRVVFYGTVTRDFSEVTYRVKATSSGRFVVPPAYAESMYERGVQARSAGGQFLTVQAPVRK